MLANASSRTIQGIGIPDFLYGTAWKEEQTARLTSEAIEKGFRGIDTANQRKHYVEAAVGQAVAASIASGTVTREALFIQTKFTFRSGQDHRLPYDPKAPLPTQVEQSLHRSLEHLQTNYLDSYILHGPMYARGISEADIDVWRAMEKQHDAGHVRLLGISNVNLEQLRDLTSLARIRPAFVQNRCYATTGWDQRVRDFCLNHDIVYQGFSLLTANRKALNLAAFRKIAQDHQRDPSQIVFRFAMQRGMLPLTGTTSQAHMALALACKSFDLSPDELNRIERLAL